ncbi:MAG: hypothetical protein EPN31_12060 [Castellaniella sp.]|uniref:DUF6776 family protein n=1 Tax=Castellaniella sp. TaxID=1955812 RepID=UPI001210EF73|nr:DUF6776 family protein [Castellaniella sp.]TAN27263.1 MAG: hypothetical protein EPN31_12060 [Castellaniella sp.]
MAGNGNGGGGLSRWLVRSLSRLLVLVLVFVAGAIVMHVGMHGGDRAHMQALQAQNGELQAKLTESQAALAAQRSQTGVQGGTQRALQDKIAELQKTLGSTQDQLSFYEQLLPPGPAGAVTVRAFDIQPKGDFLQYRVLLTRSMAEPADAFKGRLRFMATGLQDGTTVKVELSPPEARQSGAGNDTGKGTGTAADPLALSFDQYQRSTGVLQRVQGLTIQSVRVDVLEGDTVRASHEANMAAMAVVPAKDGQ